MPTENIIAGIATESNLPPYRYDIVFACLIYIETNPLSLTTMSTTEVLGVVT